MNRQHLRTNLNDSNGLFASEKPPLKVMPICDQSGLSVSRYSGRQQDSLITMPTSYLSMSDSLSYGIGEALQTNSSVDEDCCSRCRYCSCSR